MMDCATFESRLSELLAGELDPATARTVQAGLEDHAGSCPECSAAAALLELAALPPAERDPLEEPPGGYWDGFNASVASRIETASVGKTSAWWRPLAAAAAIVLALAAGWILRGRVAPGGSDPVAALETHGEWSLLEELILEATPEELASALSHLPGGQDGFEADVHGAWLPDPDEFDEIDQEQLMEWLDQLDQAEGRTTS